jgi:hypothetical protein
MQKLPNIIRFRPPKKAVTVASDSPQSPSSGPIGPPTIEQVRKNLRAVDALGRQIAGQLRNYADLLDRTKNFSDLCAAATDLDDLVEMVRLRDALARIWDHE